MTLFTGHPPLEACGLARSVSDSEFCDSKNGLPASEAAIIAFLLQGPRIMTYRPSPVKHGPGAPRRSVRTTPDRPVLLTGPRPDATFLPTLRPLSRPGRATASG